MKWPLAETQHRTASSHVVPLLMLLLLCIANCGGAAKAGTSTPTHAPTAATSTPTAMPIATPPPPLPFRPVTMPAGYVQQNFALAISPLDGRVAWTCAASGGGTFHVWLTTDAGLNWQSVATLQPATPETADCAMSADQGDTRAATFTATWGGGEAGDLGSLSLYTADSGAHWLHFSGWTATSTVDTDGTSVYAVLTITTPPSGQPQSGSLTGGSPPRLCAPCSGPPNQEQDKFVVSHDGLRTWTEPRTDVGPLDGYGPISHFWNDPASAEVYAANDGGALWRSADAGATWSNMTIPAITVSLAQRSASTNNWIFCGSAGLPLVLQCSGDTGASWHVVSTLQSSVTCASCPAKGGVAVQTNGCAPSGLETDGALIAVCSLKSEAFTTSTFTAYRLAAGASVWTALGVLPSSGCRIAPNNIVWCTNEQGNAWMTATLLA